MKGGFYLTYICFGSVLGAGLLYLATVTWSFKNKGK